MNRDPLGEAGGINLYGFVQNDPVNKIDPMGLEAIILPGPVPLPVPLPGPVKPMPVPSPLDWIKDHYNPDNWIVTAWRYWRKAIDDWLDGDECPDDEEFCRKQKEECIEMCSDIIWDPDLRHVHGGSMQQCINNCLPTICGGEGIWKGYK